MSGFYTKIERGTGRKGGHTLKRYKKYILPYLSSFILGPMLMIIEVIGEVLMPFFMSKIINVGIANRQISYLITMGIVMVITALIMLGGGVFGAYFSVKASAHFATALRKDVFHRIQMFSFANIDTFRTGSLVTRLTNDITILQTVIMMALRMLLRAPGMLIGAIIMAIKLNARLALVIAVILPILVVAIAIVIKIGLPLFHRMQGKIDAINTRIQESLTNVRVIKSFVRSDFEQEKFKETNRDLKETSLKAMKVVIFTLPIMLLIMNLTTLVVLWFGGKQVIVGDMPIGDLTAFTNYIFQILLSLVMLAMVLLQSSRAFASAKRINEVLDTTIDLTDEHARRKDAKVMKGKIEFRNVSFQYYKNTKHQVLENINCTIYPGQTVGIIGSTGSGKTSLVQLIPRLYDVDEGEVFVDDINVKDYSLKNLRSGVGMVLQKNVLFSGTIKENLVWGNETASEEAIKEVAKDAQAHEFISSFTSGYDTELGQGGVNVSGGQKQRLCIARALLKQPKILILDDSTSAVDTATEGKIRESFSTTLKETTKIMIAQRISSVKDADQILVLDEGTLVGMGTHDTLIKTCEAYQEIYYSQKGREEV